MPKWFSIGWYLFLFSKGDNPDFCSRWERAKCRAKGHPCGTIFYTITGYEPDDRCKNCGDYV